MKEYEIEVLGSDEWREFIKASKSYAIAVTKNREKGGEYPTETDKCLFCLQPLSDKEITLINSYWRLLKSAAASELSRIIQKIQEVEKALKGLAPAKFDETTTLFEYINAVVPERKNGVKSTVDPCSKLIRVKSRLDPYVASSSNLLK